jgi:hypothetical protein
MARGLGNFLLSQGCSRSNQEGYKSQKDWSHERNEDIYFFSSDST